jgi:hypothetical protein
LHCHRKVSLLLAVLILGTPSTQEGLRFLEV